VAETRPPRKPLRIFVFAAVSLFLALAVFGARYHWVEEVGTAERDGYVTQAEELLAGRIPEDPFRPLLYPLLTAGLTRLGLKPFAAARLLSNAAAVALVLLAWGFGRRLGGAGRNGLELGLWAAAATAVNPNLWILGQHVTTDMLFAALAGGCLLAALAYLERPRRSTAALVGLLYGAAAFTRGNALFLLPALALAATLAGAGDEKVGDTPRYGIRRNLRYRGRDVLLAVGCAVVALLPHWALRAAVFGDPFHDENWKNLAWKLHGYPDWSYLERVPYDGLWTVISDAPGAVLRGGLSELTRFVFGGGLSQLLGTPLHALLFAVGTAVTLTFRRGRAGWLVFALGSFLLALAIAFFTWGRLLLALLPAANALAFAALAGEPGEKLRRGLADRFPGRRAFSLRWLPRLTAIAALGLVGLLAVKTAFFRLPAFIDHHPYTEVAVLQSLEDELSPGEALAGVTPYLGRYLTRPYVALPDAFRGEIQRPELWFRKVRPRLEEAGVRFLVVGEQDLRDRPSSLLAPLRDSDASSPVPWLEPIPGESVSADRVAVWRVTIR